MKKTIRVYRKLRNFYYKVCDSVLNLNPRLQILTDEVKIKFIQLHTTYDLGNDFNPTITYHKYLIHDFKIIYREKILTLLIELERPGLLIGKAGSNIDMLSEKLGYKIFILESKLWRPEYYNRQTSFFKFNRVKIEWLILIILSSYFPLRLLVYLIFKV